MVDITGFSPRDQEIRAAFLRNLSYVMARYEEQNEASRLGESDPEFAAMFDGIVKDTAKADPEEIALVMQAMVSAAVATVEEFLEARSS